MTEPIISVGIKISEKISFVLFGDFHIDETESTYNGICKVEIRQGKLYCAVNDMPLILADQIIFSPSYFASEYFTLRDVVIGSKFHWEKKEKESFRGSLKLFVVDKKIYAVNLINLEEYLRSVISSEMNAKCSFSFLKAHSVISRSWLLSQIENAKARGSIMTNVNHGYENESEIIRWYDREDHQYFDVCADDHCQRYQGITKIDSMHALDAVDQTAGLVLTYKESICDARFSKCCGGISESFENVWQDTPHQYLSSVIDYKYEPDEMELDLRIELYSREWINNSPDVFCNTVDKKVIDQLLPEHDQDTKDFFRWSISYSQAQLSKLIAEKTGIDFGNIVDLIPIERGRSGRIIKLKIIGTNRNLIIGKELEIRKALSKTHLYSSAFYVQKLNIVNDIPEEIILHGAGWGHGAGLCQIGAAVMATRGYNFDEILLHYYTDAKISKIY